MKKVKLGSIVEFSMFDEATKSVVHRFAKINSFEFNHKQNDLWFDVYVYELNGEEFINEPIMIDSKMIVKVIN